MERPLLRFLFRWFVNGLGLWIAASIFDKIDYSQRLVTVVIAGLILSVVNAVLKPLIVVLSLPAILLSLGLFMVVINGLMVVVVSALYKPFHVEGFGAAVLAGLVIGLVNYLVTIIVGEIGRKNG